MLRSPLFIPGNRPNMLKKALILSPDAYIPDLEDSVPIDQKNNAREITSSFIPKLNSTGTAVIPRINPMSSGLFEKDLEAVVGPHIFGLSIGKVNCTEDVLNISTAIESQEKKTGLNVGVLKLVLWLETAKAIVNAYQISSASSRIIAVAFGGEDFTTDMAIERKENNSEISYPRNAVCIAARAAGVMALDTPYFSFQNPDGLMHDALEAKSYGFRGKFAIHPSQIEPINSMYSPMPEEVEYASRVIEVFKQAVTQGRGATSLDGHMVDIPVVKRAERLLDIARAISERQNR